MPFALPILGSPPVQMAKYYCAVCHLWEDGDRSIYHCDACRICRIGKGLGIDYFHCTVCDACLTISSRESHQCVAAHLCALSLTRRRPI